MKKTFGKRGKLFLQFLGQEGRMDFQMKPHTTLIPGKNIKHFTCSVYIVVEGTVQYSDIPDSVRTDVFQPGFHLLHTLISDRLFASADTESTGVETASGGLQLDKRLVPAEETAFFRISQRSEVRHSGYAVIMIPAVISGYPA